MIPTPNYTAEEHGTWSLMFNRQEDQLPSRACREYLEGLRKINFTKDSIPRLQDVSEALAKATGWKIIRVDGLVPEKEFFAFLSRKEFPSTDFIRARADLKYTPAPDMFHDLFGHTPMITHPRFAQFFQEFGKAALNADEEEVKRLQRFYWFTVEFGLIRNPEGRRIYGSGILSSIDEVAYCLSDKVTVHPFNVEQIIKQEYDIWHMQDVYFEIDSFEQLEDSFKAYARSKKLLA